MNTFKKLTAVLLCLSMVFALAACSEEEPADNSAELEAIQETLAEGSDDCNHTWSKWDEMVEASCTNDGIEVRTCETCGKQESQTLPAFGHDFDDGRCSDCDRKEKRCEHDDTEEVIIKAPTCTEKGKMHEICEECKAVVDDERLPALGHSYVWRDYQDATCTEQGWYGHEICENCGDGYVDYIAPYGHSFAGGVCQQCQATNEAFTTLTVEGIPQNPLVIEGAVTETYTATPAQIDVVTGSFTAEDEVHSYTLTTTTAGVYRLWFTEVYSGNYMNLYISNSLGEQLKWSSWCGNNDGFTVTLEPGTYTVQVEQRSGLTSYNLNVGYQKAVVDVTPYGKLIDSIDFTDQEIYYTFTPAETGLYRFTLGEMISSLDVNLALYNYLGEQLYWSSWCGNGDGLTATTLNAGETYLICVQERSGTGTFHLSIGKQTATTDISGYNSISDSLTFQDQQNFYTFVADSASVRFEIMDLVSDAYVDLRLYNYLGETVASDSWCSNGEGFTVTDLVIGNTYTVRVEQYSGLSGYTLNMHTEKAPVDITTGMGVIDSIEYSDQVNVYNLSVSEGGIYYLYILDAEGSADSNVWDDASVSVYVYDSNGYYVNGYSYMDGGDSMWLELESGEYMIQVHYCYGRPAYMLSVE